MALFLDNWTDILVLVIIIGLDRIVCFSREIRIIRGTWLGVAVATTVCAWPLALLTRTTLRTHLVALDMALLAYEAILRVSHEASQVCETETAGKQNALTSQLLCGGRGPATCAACDDGGACPLHLHRSYLAHCNH